MKRKILGIAIGVLALILVLGHIIKVEPDYSLTEDGSTFYVESVYSDMSALDFALGFYDLRESKGSVHNPVILDMADGLVNWYTDDEIPWCSLFQNYIWASTGHEYSGSLLARSWLEVGEKINYKDIRRGDVVVLWRGSKDGIKGHVGQFINWKGDYVGLYGGNQANKAGVNYYKSDRILGIRRPRKIDNGTFFLGNDSFVVSLKSE